MATATNELANPDKKKEITEKYRVQFRTQFNFVKESLHMSATSRNLDEFGAGIDMAIEQMQILLRLASAIKGELGEVEL